MNPVLKNILAVLAGLVFGSVVNMGLIMIGSSIVAPPEGVDITSVESIKASMHLFQPRHFIFPFLAHAIGTFAGAYLTIRLAAKHPLRLSMIVGAFFFLGGLTNAFMIPAPLWFILADLILAYLPMVWLAGKVARTAV
jgi:hypothetical protein